MGRVFLGICLDILFSSFKFVHGVLSLPSFEFIISQMQVQRIRIDYAKSAKRVDVKKLKSSMWSYLTKPTAAKGKVSGEHGRVRERERERERERAQGSVKGTEKVTQRNLWKGTILLQVACS